MLLYGFETSVTNIDRGSVAKADGSYDAVCIPRLAL